MPPYPDHCPACGSDQRGDEIPEEHRYLYGGGDRFYRTIGIYSVERDRTVAWRCPDCHHEWPRT